MGGVHIILFFCENLPLQVYVSSQEMYMYKILIDLQRFERVRICLLLNKSGIKIIFSGRIIKIFDYF